MNNQPQYNFKINQNRQNGLNQIYHQPINLARQPPFQDENDKYISNNYIAGQITLNQTLQNANQHQNAIQQLKNNSLQTKARLNFIVKVYLIVITLLLITMGICFISYNVEEIRNFQIKYWWITFIFLAPIILFTILIECTPLGKTHPSNLIILIAFTICFSYIISYTTSIYALKYGGPLVIQIFIITIALVLALTIYAFVSKTDFNTWFGIVIVVVVAFIAFGISCALTYNPILYSLYCTFGVILAGIILIIDTQMIVRKQKDRSISLDDYVSGALTIYIDIIRLFLYILMSARRQRT